LIYYSMTLCPSLFLCLHIAPFPFGLLYSLTQLRRYTSPGHLRHGRSYLCINMSPSYSQSSSVHSFPLFHLNLQPQNLCMPLNKTRVRSGQVRSGQVGLGLVQVKFSAVRFSAG